MASTPRPVASASHSAAATKKPVAALSGALGDERATALRRLVVRPQLLRVDGFTVIGRVTLLRGSLGAE